MADAPQTLEEKVDRLTREVKASTWRDYLLLGLGGLSLWLLMRRDERERSFFKTMKVEY